MKQHRRDLVALIIGGLLGGMVGASVVKYQCRQDRAWLNHIFEQMSLHYVECVQERSLHESKRNEP